MWGVMEKGVPGKRCPGYGEMWKRGIPDNLNLYTFRVIP